MANRKYSPPYYRNLDYNRDFDFYYNSFPYGSAYGRYSGYGPRSYERSDERILEDINDRLTWHSMIDATDINVAVNNGIATLTGSVDTRGDKRLAEDIADDVPGVWDVDNRLTVRNKHPGWTNRGEFRPGLEVMDSDGAYVGTVKEVRSGDFLLDRPIGRDVYVPFADCDLSDGKVRLNVRSDQIDQQGWLMMPEAAESQKK